MRDRFDGQLRGGISHHIDSVDQDARRQTVALAFVNREIAVAVDRPACAQGAWRTTTERAWLTTRSVTRLRCNTGWRRLVSRMRPQEFL